MMGKPIISVVIPTYNRAHCVGEAIESVLNQTFRDFELIVVDDGSTDNTQEVLSQYGDAIRVIRQENKGVSAARNAGIEAAKGEWVAFLDSDDLWLPEKLEVQIRDITKWKEAIAHMVDAKIIGYENFELTLFELRGLKEEFNYRPYRKRPLIDVLKAQFFTPTWLLKREMINGNKLKFNTSLKIYEDMDFLSVFALYGPFIINVESLVNIRRIGYKNNDLSSIHQTNPVISLSHLCKIYLNLIKSPNLSNPEKIMVKRQLSGARYELSLALKNIGKYDEARLIRWQSFLDQPGLKSFIRAGVSELNADCLWDKLRQLKNNKKGFRRSEYDLKR